MLLVTLKNSNMAAAKKKKVEVLKLEIQKTVANDGYFHHLYTVYICS